MKDLFKHYIYPIATLAGSIIGVGFLSLPYITLEVGFWPMLFYFIAVTAIITLIHVVFAQIALKTPDHKRFPGFVGFYLGNVAKVIILISVILSSVAVMVIYLIVGSQFLHAMFSAWFGGSMIDYVLIYFIACAVVIYFGIKTMSRFEFWALLLLLTSLCIIAIKSAAHITLGNIPFNTLLVAGNWKILFLPYGALMFALWGVGLIPEIEETLAGRKKTLKKVIIIGTLIPAAIYFLFTLLILGISGARTSESALI
ncbi:MAG: aromatic amino acid transport family protein, partial [Candidatus Paceibacterales bacterium]